MKAFIAIIYMITVCAAIVLNEIYGFFTWGY